jgi:hypothetical protein
MRELHRALPVRVTTVSLHRDSVSQAGCRRTSFGVAREILGKINRNSGIPRKIRYVPRNIARISVRQLAILVPMDMKNNFMGSPMGKGWETWETCAESKHAGSEPLSYFAPRQ